MKNLEEIDCNEEIWNGITSNLQNGWGNLENECRFAFKTLDKEITEDEIDLAFYMCYPDIDQIQVVEVELDKEDYEDVEEDMRYFGVSMIIYNSGI
jgi:hypothetical protein